MAIIKMVALLYINLRGYWFIPAVPYFFLFSCHTPVEPKPPFLVDVALSSSVVRYLINIP